jgi:hypothetical protein
MCLERLTDTFEKTDIRAAETTSEGDLERPETWHGPTEKPDETLERDKEFAHA